MIATGILQTKRRVAIIVATNLIAMNVLGLKTTELTNGSRTSIKENERGAERAR